MFPSILLRVYYAGECLNMDIYHLDGDGGGAGKEL